MRRHRLSSVTGQERRSSIAMLRKQANHLLQELTSVGWRAIERARGGLTGNAIYRDSGRLTSASRKTRNSGCSDSIQVRSVFAAASLRFCGGILPGLSVIQDSTWGFATTIQVSLFARARSNILFVASKCPSESTTTITASGGK